MLFGQIWTLQFTVSCSRRRGFPLLQLKENFLHNSCTQLRVRITSTFGLWYVCGGLSIFFGKTLFYITGQQPSFQHKFTIHLQHMDFPGDLLFPEQRHCRASSPRSAPATTTHNKTWQPKNCSSKGLQNRSNDLLYVQELLNKTKLEQKNWKSMLSSTLLAF